MQYGLRPGLELFRAADGTVYLIRDQTVAEFTIEGADERQRALLELLERPRTPAELTAALEAVGRPMPDPELRRTLNQLEELGILAQGAPLSGLSDEDAIRYDRQLAYFAEVGPAADMQRRLGAATVAIVGVGGLGSWTASALASAGIGHLRLVDHDTIELSNLNRQTLYRRADVGRRKVEVASAALCAFNPQLRVTADATRVDSPEAAERVADGADFLVETADHPPYVLSRWLDAACWDRGTPRIVASQFPPRVRIGPTYIRGHTGCLDCQERAARGAYPLHDELVAFRARRTETAPTLGPASGIIGAALAMDVVHHLTGIALPATLGIGITIDLRDWSVERERVESAPDCPRCQPRE